MKELSPDTLVWIAEAAAQDDPTEQDRERIRARLIGRLGVAAFAQGALTTQAGSAVALGSKSLGAGSVAPTATLGAGTKLLLALGAASAIGSAALLALQQPEPPASQQTSLAPETLKTQSMAATPAAVEPKAVPIAAKAPLVQQLPAASAVANKAAGTSRKRPHRAKEPARPAAPSRELALAQELALLGRAQEQLRDENYQAALKVAEEHARRYPDGVLSEEREGIETLARCGLGSGRDRAISFLKRAGGSPLSERIRKACDLE